MVRPLALIAACVQWRNVADQAEGAEICQSHGHRQTGCAGLHKLSKPHWTKLHSTNPIGRLNGEITQRTDGVVVFPNDDAVVRLAGALLLEQNDEWAVQRSRYMNPETIATMSDDSLISMPAVAS
ncbi:MAG: transposase [Hoeflea sp.]|uniref:transposase n=1 Tax=Hoeflea sp. TaxID=1940281 RepID=UPI003298991A